MPSVSVRIGYVGAHLSSYYAREYKVTERSVHELKALADELKFELISWHEPIETADDAVKVRRRMEELDVDLLLVQNSSFSMGDLIRVFSDSRLRLGLWGVPDPFREGPVKVHSLTAANLYASILRRYVGAGAPRYKWFYGYPGDPMFSNRFRVTLQALRSAKALRKSKIGWIGGVAPTFYNLSFDERKLRRRLGTEIHIHETRELIAAARSVSDTQAMNLSAAWKKGAVRVTTKDEYIEKNARLYLAMRHMAEKNGYTGLAVSCWPDFQTDWQVAPCLSYSQLNDIEGLPVSCEGDVLGVLTMIALNAASGNQSMLMDLADIDLEDGSALLWHCGVAPARYADESGVAYTDHSTVNRKQEGAHPVGASLDFTFRPQPVTVSRISGDADEMLAWNAELVSREVPGFAGTRGWMRNVTCRGKPLTMADILQTMMVRGLEHHYAVTAGHVERAMTELAYWLDLRLTEPVPYRDEASPEDAYI